MKDHLKKTPVTVTKNQKLSPPSSLETHSYTLISLFLGFLIQKEALAQPIKMPYPDISLTNTAGNTLDYGIPIITTNTLTNPELIPISTLLNSAHLYSMNPSVMLPQNETPTIVHDSNPHHLAVIASLTNTEFLTPAVDILPIEPTLIALEDSPLESNTAQTGSTDSTINLAEVSHSFFSPGYLLLAGAAIAGGGFALSQSSSITRNEPSTPPLAPAATDAPESPLVANQVGLTQPTIPASEEETLVSSSIPETTLPISHLSNDETTGTGDVSADEPPASEDATLPSDAVVTETTDISVTVSPDSEPSITEDNLELEQLNALYKDQTLVQFTTNISSVDYLQSDDPDDTNVLTLHAVLYNDTTPLTVENFLSYVNNDAYDYTFAHRVLPDFIFQIGGFTYTNQLQEIPSSAPVVNEPGQSNTPGTIAMAKIGGDPHSATNQFFFNLADNSANLDHQNGGFTVFGHVLGNSMDTLQVIESYSTFDLDGEGSLFNNTPIIDTSYDTFTNNLVTFTDIRVIPVDEYYAWLQDNRPTAIIEDTPLEEAPIDDTDNPLADSSSDDIAG